MTHPLKSSLKALFLSLVSAGTLALGEPLFWLIGRRRASQPALADARRILVVRLDQIGDLVLTTPFLRELKRNAPLARITLVVKPELRELALTLPSVDEVLTFDWHLARRSDEWRRRLRVFGFCAAHLWPRRFELAIVPRWDADWYCQTLIAYGSGAPRRIGYSEDVDLIKRIHNHGYDRLLTQTLHQKSVEHEVERGLDVLRALGGTAAETQLEGGSGPAADAWARAWLEDNIPDNAPLIALGPFAGNSVLKQWPLPNFAALGRRLIADGGRIVIVGGPGDREQAEHLCAKIGPGAVNVAGACFLPQTAAVLRRCTLFVGDDSGPMHLAAAAGIPVVALFGPSCPHRFRPWTPSAEVVWHQLPCSPCSAAAPGENHADCCTVCIHPEPLCIQSITVEEVQAAIERTGVLAICV